jgi:hypothetical protein
MLRKLSRSDNRCSSTTASSKPRGRKNSLLFLLPSNMKKEISTPIEAISHRIKEVVTRTFEPVEYESKSLTTDLEITEVQVGTELFKVRKVFLCYNKYQIGWVVDSDITQCMICQEPYSWRKLRHHCRFAT